MQKKAFRIVIWHWNEENNFPFIKNHSEKSTQVSDDISLFVKADMEYSIGLIPIRKSVINWTDLIQLVTFYTINPIRGVADFDGTISKQ